MIQEKSMNTTFKDDNMEVESPSQHHADSDEDEDDSDDEIEQFAKKLEEERKAEETKLYAFMAITLCLSPSGFNLWVL